MAYEISTSAGVVEEISDEKPLWYAIGRARTYGENTTLRSGSTIRWASSDVTERMYPLTRGEAVATVATAKRHMDEQGYSISIAEPLCVFGHKGGWATHRAAAQRCSWDTKRYRMI